MRATERLWLTRDGKKLVKDGHPKAGTLFCTPGMEISDKQAKKYGLKALEKDEDKSVEKDEDKGGGLTIKAGGRVSKSKG